MENFKVFQKVRLLTKEQTIANGVYIDDEVIIRVKEGFLHSDFDNDGDLQPAIETRDGNHREFWKDGLLHNENGPAVIDNTDNYEEWYFEGKKIEPKN